MSVFLPASVVFVVSFLRVFQPQYRNLFQVNWLPCSLTLKLFLEANAPFYLILAVVLCKGRIKLLLLLLLLLL